jgi:hydrogenase maturation protease
MPDCVIIGIGNLIKKDDGVGVHVVRGLAGRVPGDVELIEGGVYCADLHGFIEGCRKAIFIDGIDAGEEPGAVFRFTPDEVPAKAGRTSMSIHDFGLYDLIKTARLMDQCPEEITIFAVQVKDVDLGMEMTTEVAGAVEKVCRLVIEELGGA